MFRTVRATAAVCSDVTLVTNAITMARNGVLIQVASVSGWPVRHATAPPW